MRPTWIPLALCATLLAGGTAASPARHAAAGCATDEISATPPTAASRGPIPFRDGERLAYGVSFLRFRVGSGSMQLSTDTVRGQRTWRARLGMDAGFAFLGVHDTTTSWFDTSSFNSLRFVEHLHEPHYHADRETEIFPDRRTYHQRGRPETASVASPMDYITLVYYARTLPLRPHECYVLPRFYQPSGNPVIIHVLRREPVTVPAGTFNAVVIRPEITTTGIFAQNGRAEVWLSDDSARVVLRLASHLSFGSIALYLRADSSAARGE